VAYFSATNTTKGMVELIADGLSADIYEIVPKEPYIFFLLGLILMSLHTGMHWKIVFIVAGHYLGVILQK
jgi:hypothetical protein